MKQIDPRLLEQLDNASDDDELEALVILDKSADEEGGEPSHESLVAEAAATSERQPSEMRYLSRLGVLYVRGSGGLVRTILEDRRVVSASGSDPDVYVPGDAGDEEE